MALLLLGWPAGADPSEDVLARLVGIEVGEGRYRIDWQGTPPAGAAVHGLAYDARARWLTGSVETGGRSRRVEGRVRLITEVPTTRHPVVAGTVLSLADLGAIEVDLLDGHPQLLRAENLIVDRMAKRDLEPGRPILARDLREAPMVGRNDIVTIIARRGRVTVKTKAKALDAGAMGQMVRAQNLDSRRVVSAIVVDRGLLEVEDVRP